MTVQAILGVALAFALVPAGASLHVDPRPFLVNPSQPALYPHPADNGSPSQHTTSAATAAFVVMTFRRRLGWAPPAAGCAIPVFDTPSAPSSTIRARCASPARIDDNRVHRVSSVPQRRDASV